MFSDLRATSKKAQKAQWSGKAGDGVVVSNILGRTLSEKLSGLRVVEGLGLVPPGLTHN